MHIILFDGVCNFCNASINFIIDRDSKNKFKFAALQSALGQQLLHTYEVEITRSLDSVVLIKNNRIYNKSEAALEIARDLDGFWPLFYILKVVPVSMRNFFYDILAANRYKLFGKADSCRMPTPELQQKFL